MSENATIYSIDVTHTRDELSVAEAAKVSLGDKYTSMTVTEIAGKLILLGYDSASQKCDTYILTDSDPWVAPIDNKLELHSKAGWDIIEPFTLGDQPHLCCYRKEDGEFAFYPVHNDLTVHYPLYFRHPRHPLTPNLSEVKPRESLGQVFLTGYDTEHGYVNNWIVSVTATSDGKHPPLAVNVVWAHQWAKGWTRFAWFTWGGQNFFLKTNTWKPNVNIDHMSSVLSEGSSEVGTHLVLKDAQKLDIVHPFMVGSGDPHFLTYIAETGEATFNRIHGDCLGWTTVAEQKTEPGATHIVLYRIGETNYALYA